MDPDAKTIEVFVLGGAGLEPQRIYRDRETLTSTLIEGLCIEVGPVFPA